MVVKRNKSTLQHRSTKVLQAQKNKIKVLYQLKAKQTEN